MQVVFLLSLSLGADASAQPQADCAELKRLAKNAVQRQYRFDEHRAVVARVLGRMTPQEAAELAELSARFKALPHDTPENQESHFKMQARSRQIVRAATARAGYRLLNPRPGTNVDPFDAEIGERLSEDGYTEYAVEVRSLLVMDDPRPHVTLWLRRSDPTHNPRLIVTISVTAQENGDYMTWMVGGRRVSGDLDKFVEGGLPPSCR